MAPSHSTKSVKNRPGRRSPVTAAPQGGPAHPGARRGRRKHPQQRNRKGQRQTYGRNAQAMGNMSSGGSSSEVADNSTNVVTEDFGSGATATRSVVASNSADSDQFISSTTEERNKFKKRAPELFNQFQTAVENFKRADTEVASHMARSDIDGILNSAPKDLDASVASIRSKVEALFQRSQKKWKAQQAAKDLVLPDAQKLQQLARESGIRDPKQLRDYLKQYLYHHHNAEALANQAGGRDIVGTLLDKGALG